MDRKQKAKLLVSATWQYSTAETVEVLPQQPNKRSATKKDHLKHAWTWQVSSLVPMPPKQTKRLKTQRLGSLVAKNGLRGLNASCSARMRLKKAIGPVEVAIQRKSKSGDSPRICCVFSGVLGQNAYSSCLERLWRGTIGIRIAPSIRQQHVSFAITSYGLP